MQVNCFVLTLSTLLINRCAAVGLHMKAQRSIAKQPRGKHEGLKLPWRRMPVHRAAGIVRYSYSLYHHVRRKHVFANFHGMCSHHCADRHDVVCRPGSPDAACTQIIEQGLAAEHALDMRKAIVCFEVVIFAFSMLHLILAPHALSTRKQLFTLLLIFSLSTGF